jgi:hypothetical protein
MKHNLNLIIGNHRSPAGISDICELFTDALKFELKTNLFADESKVNLIIEDFSSKDFTDYLINNNIEICLILTEFMRKGLFGKIYLNRFGLKSHPISIISGDIFIAILRILNKFLPQRFRIKIEKLIYWKNRELGLRRVLTEGNLLSVICLHPEIEAQTRQILKSSKIKHFATIYPRLNNIKRLNTDTSNMTLVSFGSKNRYRKKQIRKFNESFPMQILAPNFTDTSQGDNIEIDNGFIDVYFRNSKDWPFLSPVRFWRTLRKGSMIVYFGHEKDDHPIYKCGQQIPNFYSFPFAMSNFSEVVAETRSNIKKYDEIAKIQNEQVAQILERSIFGFNRDNA